MDVFVVLTDFVYFFSEQIECESQPMFCFALKELSHKLQRPMQIVGWYHSHPHITVWPSHLGWPTLEFFFSAKVLNFLCRVTYSTV